jgi:hypothetical protein
MNGVVRPPDGFTLVLPEQWIGLDLNPETAEESTERLVDALARNDAQVADECDEVAALLGAMAREAIEGGALLCAVHFDVDGRGRPVQASMAVTIRSVGGSSEPAALQEDLDDGLVEAKVVELASGPALRISERTEDGFVSLGMLVPAPGIESRVAVISLLTPSVSHEAEFGEFFDLIADTFRFTWDEAGEEATG